METNQQEQTALQASALAQAHNKDAVERMARERGWRGDPARTSKEALAQYVVMHGDAPLAAEAQAMVPATEPQRVEPLRAVAGEAKNATTVAQAIAAALAGVRLGADPEEVRAMVREEVAHLQPARIVIRPGGEQVKIEDRTHPAFEKVMRLVAADLNVLLVGPAGCGKTTLAHHIAKGLGRKFGALHCTAGASESQLVGYLLPVAEGGRFVYVPTEFTRLYEAGNSVFLLDEIDAADPNMLLVINSALSNGSLHVPQRYENPHIPRGKGAAIIAAANTYGHGADLVYAGRNQLDAATLDRFYVVEMGYDEGLEHAIAGRAYTPAAKWEAAEKPTAQELAALGEWVAAIREKIASLKLRRIASTRMLQKAIAARMAGVPTVEVKRDLLAGWTRDELAKVGA